MIHATHQKLLRLCTVLLVLFFMAGIMVQSANAAETENSWKKNIELTGEFVGTFSLDSNTAQILRVTNAAPGDVWTGEITIKNGAGGPMEVALLSIVSSLEDIALFNALKLDIQVGASAVYSGSYGATSDPISPFYVIPAGQSLVMNVQVSFPPELGNEMQGKEMDSIWTFEARYLGDGPGPALYPYTVMYVEEETGERLADDKLSYAPYGEIVTETALEIPGFIPDAEEKTIKISAEDNLIVFLYKEDISNEPAKGPDTSEEPSEGNSGSGKGVPTGTDLAHSNTSNLIYGLLIGVCLLAILITYLRIRATPRRSRD